MPVEGPNGGDPTKAINQQLESDLKQVTGDAMDIWFSAAQDRLVAAAAQRSGSAAGGSDDSEGKQYRQQNNLTDLLDEFQPPQWDEGEQAWTWAITHHAAVFHEWGADAHEIEAKHAQALAFEWPDAPQEVREEYESTFPTIFKNSVEHPGTPAIGMVRHGRTIARRRLEKAGYGVDGFGMEGED